MGIPQWIMVLLILCDVAANAIKATGWRPKPKRNLEYAVLTFMSPAFLGGILWWGGFFG